MVRPRWCSGCRRPHLGEPHGASIHVPIPISMSAPPLPMPLRSENPKRWLENGPRVSVLGLVDGTEPGRGFEVTAVWNWSMGHT